MKHWSDFMPKRTHTVKRMAKFSNGLLFESEQKKIELLNAVRNHQEHERQIIDQVASHYDNETELKKAIELAVKKADTWNTSPVLELQNPNNKKTL